MWRVAAAITISAALAGCSVGNPESTDADGFVSEVVIATHDSWAAPKGLIEEFEADTGYHVTIVPSGDAGQLTNKLVLTKDNPIADGVYGVDNTFATRAIDEGVLEEYRSSGLDPGDYDLPGDGAERLTPVDWGDVCVNVDDAWFAEHGVTPPKTLSDLTDPRYNGLFVTPGAASSSPGFAFLLSTIGTFGDDWPAYWEELMANGTKVTSGWTDAYTVDFTAGGGDGSRPIVLSYNSSPPFTIPKGEQKPTTSALLDTCFRQVEYAGVLSGAENPEGAKAFVDFLVSRPFQESLPEHMYVFPVDSQARLPKQWARWAPPSPNPIEVDPDAITEERADWLTKWSDVTSR